MFLQNKLFSNDEKYEDVIDDLYYKDILSYDDINIIQNNYRSKDKKKIALIKKLNSRLYSNGK